VAKEYIKNPAAVDALSPEQYYVTQKSGTNARSAPSVSHPSHALTTARATNAGRGIASTQRHSGSVRHTSRRKDVTSPTVEADSFGSGRRLFSAVHPVVSPGPPEGLARTQAEPYEKAPTHTRRAAASVSISRRRNDGNHKTLFETTKEDA